MAKRTISFIMALALLLPLCACASVFEKTYFSVSDYVDTEQDPEPPKDGTVEVRSYTGLKAALSSMITAHEESGVLSFRKYDGSVSEDLAAASKEISTQTALGAYSVDFISYDMDRIVAYYEVTVYITYTRTAEEIEAIVNVQTLNGLKNAVVDALEKLDSTLVVSMYTGAVGTNEVLSRVESAICANPTLCPVKPRVSVGQFSGSGMSRIFEINFDYDADLPGMRLKRTQLTDALESMLTGITAETDLFKAFQAANLLAANCRWDDEAGNTAYSALVESQADSEGMAMAYCAMMQALEIPCRVVSGRLNTEQHSWNVVEIDGDWYHVDVSRVMAEGFSSTFLLNDSFMLGRYWWDTELYPACTGGLSYNTAILGN